MSALRTKFLTVSILKKISKIIKTLKKPTSTPKNILQKLSEKGAKLCF